MSIDLYSLYDIDISNGVDADLFITNNPGEDRALKISSLQTHASKLNWYISSNSSQKDLSEFSEETPQNISTYREEQLEKELTNWISSNQNINPSVFIDISCMSHALMACIIKTICIAAETFTIKLTVGYVIAEFATPPKELPPNEDIKPIDNFFAGWPSNASAATSLILGLGYEKEKAEGACEYFDASETWVFHPKSPISNYDKEVQNNNRALLERLERKNRALSYYVNAPSNAFGQLVSLILSALPTSNPVILPFGPKIFFVLSTIAAALYREVGVWHVTGDSSSLMPNQQASNFLIGFQATFGPAKD